MATKEQIEEWLFYHIDRPRNFESRAQAIDNISSGSGISKYNISMLYGKLGDKSLEQWAKDGLVRLIDWIYNNDNDEIYEKV